MMGGIQNARERERQTFSLSFFRRRKKEEGEEHTSQVARLAGSLRSILRSRSLNEALYPGTDGVGSVVPHDRKDERERERERAP